MATDSDIRRNVENELEWDSDIGDADIAVSVKDHVVTLAGFVHSFADKIHAEQAAKRVAGVSGLANDIAVRLDGEARPDPDIARDAVAALQAALPAICTSIRAVVEDGTVRLEGQVPWHYQRVRAETAVRNVRGVRHVSNLIALKPAVSPGAVRDNIVAAFQRSATIDAGRLNVEATGNTVTLTGRVRSWAERSDAERAAWNAPGVTVVDNRLIVDASLPV